MYAQIFTEEIPHPVTVRKIQIRPARYELTPKGKDETTRETTEGL